jgi:probable HAF family extracellular repeat protein
MVLTPVAQEMHQTTSLWRPLACAVAAVLTLSFQPLAKGACPRYEVQTIPGPPCQFVFSQSSANGISETGEMCGGYSTCNESGFGAVWIGQGWWIPLPLPPGVPWIAPTDINSSRQLATDVPDSGNPEVLRRAAFYDFNTSTLINLGVLPGGNHSEAHAINENGAVCGLSMNTVTGPLEGFVWENGQMTALNLPLGPNSHARDIADTGAICGWMGDAVSTGAHAYILRDGEITDLGSVLKDGIGADARGISSNGEVVCGFSVFSTPAPTRYAFVWHNGHSENLGVLAGYDHDRSIAYAVNNDAVVVGQSTNDDLVGKTFVWRNGVMTALNDLIPPGLNIDIRGIPTINNAGQIACNARVLDDKGSSTGDQVAVRLTPIQPPPGDCDCNGVVNIDDLLRTINQWGPAIPTTSADFNNDGLVNVADILTVIQEWD